MALVEPDGKPLIDHLPEAAEFELAPVRFRDHVGMGAHEAVGANENAMLRGVLLEEGEEKLFGFGRFEDEGGVVTAPSAVVGRAKIDEEATRHTRHGG